MSICFSYAHLYWYSISTRKKNSLSDIFVKKLKYVSVKFTGPRSEGGDWQPSNSGPRENKDRGYTRGGGVASPNGPGESVS